MLATTSYATPSNGQIETFLAKNPHYIEVIYQKMRNLLAIILIPLLGWWVVMRRRNPRKTNLKFVTFSFHLWRHQWRHHDESYIKWKPWVWSYWIRSFKLKWPPGGAREQNENLAFFGSRAPPRGPIDLIFS